MSNRKQTSVEWLRDKLFNEFGFAFSDNIFEQAKQLNRQEIIDAYAEGAENEFAMGSVSRSDYYKNTFKG